MREPSGSPEADAQFLKTLNKLNSGPDKTSVFRGVDYDPASTAARAERSGGAQPTVTQPSVTQPSGGNMGGSRPSKEVAEERQSQQEAEDKKWGWNMSGSKPTATTSVTTPLDNGSNVLLANDPLKQTGGPIPQLFGGGVGGGVPTDADVLKDLKRKRFGIAAFGDDPAEWGL
jgi:hypothetical protein